MKHITSRDNPIFKDLVKLSGSSRQRKHNQLTVLDGSHLLGAYLDSGGQPQHIFINSRANDGNEINELLARLQNVPVTMLDDKLFGTVSELRTPTGLLSLIAIPQTNLESVHFGLLLEEIQDPGNLGSMLRAAAAAGCDAIFLSPGCADVWSPKVLRAAMGGHFMLHIHEQQDLPAVAKQLGCRLYATLPHAAISLYDTDLSGDIGFMVGNEGAGLSTELQAFATHALTIPMPGRIESLNAASATAICLFEAVRQRH